MLLSCLLQSDGTRKDKTNRKLRVPVSESIYGGLTKDEIMEAQEKERQLTEQDRTMELTKDKRNSLESYVYEMRNKVQFNIFMKCISFHTIDLIQGFMVYVSIFLFLRTGIE